MHISRIVLLYFENPLAKAYFFHFKVVTELRIYKKGVTELQRANNVKKCRICIESCTHLVLYTVQYQRPPFKDPGISSFRKSSIIK